MIVGTGEEAVVIDDDVSRVVRVPDEKSEGVVEAAAPRDYAREMRKAAKYENSAEWTSCRVR